MLMVDATDDDECVCGCTEVLLRVTSCWVLEWGQEDGSVGLVLVLSLLYVLVEEVAWWLWR